MVAIRLIDEIRSTWHPYPPTPPLPSRWGPMKSQVKGFHALWKKGTDMASDANKRANFAARARSAFLTSRGAVQRAEMGSNVG
jgi:hypothetical protein